MYGKLENQLEQEVKLADDALRFQRAIKLFSKLTVKAVSFMQPANNTQISLTSFMAK